MDLSAGFPDSRDVFYTAKSLLCPGPGKDPKNKKPENEGSRDVSCTVMIGLITEQRAKMD
jgi:hypothetical protein